MRTLLAAIALLFFATFAQGQSSTRVISPGIAISTTPGAFAFEPPIDTVAPCWKEAPDPDTSHVYWITPGTTTPFQTLEWKASPWPSGLRVPVNVPSFPEEPLRIVKWNGIGWELNSPLDTSVSPKWGLRLDDPAPTVEMETAVVSELPFPEGGWQEDYLEQQTSTRSVRLSYFSTFGEQSAPEYYRVIVPSGDSGAAYIYDWGAGGRGFAPGEHVSVVNYPFNGVVQEAEIWHPGFNKHLVPLPRVISGDVDLTFVRIGDICQYVPTSSIVPTP